jgi:hypothetical protein
MLSIPFGRSWQRSGYSGGASRGNWRGSWSPDHFFLPSVLNSSQHIGSYFPHAAALVCGFSVDYSVLGRDALPMRYSASTSGLRLYHRLPTRYRLSHIGPVSHEQSSYSAICFGACAGVCKETIDSRGVLDLLEEPGLSSQQRTDAECFRSSSYTAKKRSTSSAHLPLQLSPEEILQTVPDQSISWLFFIDQKF